MTRIRTQWALRGLLKQDRRLLEVNDRDANTAISTIPDADKRLNEQLRIRDLKSHPRYVAGGMILAMVHRYVHRFSGQEALAPRVRGMELSPCAPFIRYGG